MSNWYIQDLADSVSGRVAPAKRLTTEEDLFAELDKYRDSDPRIVSLTTATGDFLNLGIGGPVSYLEQVPRDPKWGAITARPRSSFHEPNGLGYVSFRQGRIGTEIAEEWIMPLDEALEIVRYIYRHNDLPDWVEWVPS